MHRRRRHSGNAVVETAVIASFMLVLLLGVIVFGTIFQATIRLETAAREGARVGTTGGSNADIQEAVLKNLTRTGDVADVPGEAAVSIDPSDEAARVFNSTVSVEVWWKYPIPVPLFNLIVTDRMLYARKKMVVTVGN